MKALVVGGTGFLGAAVAAALVEQGLDAVSLSRSGTACVGSGVRGDVRLPGLGVEPDVAAELLDGLTHVVSCFGSVEWGDGPRQAIDLHAQGTRAVLEFAAGCPHLQRLVHVSSVLALGRADGVIRGAELELGQGFRSWYDYGKFLAERTVREAWPFARRCVRLGPVLGVTPWAAPTADAGLLAIIPFLLRGYPISVRDRGAFPSFVCDANTAGRVIARAAIDDGPWPDVTTWFDDRMWSLAQVLNALCSAWGTVPRIVEAPLINEVARLLASRLGVAKPLLEYAEPWVDIPAAVLTQLPADLPRCPKGYLEATGHALRANAAEAICA